MSAPDIWSRLTVSSKSAFENASTTDPPMTKGSVAQQSMAQQNVMSEQAFSSEAPLGTVVSEGLLRGLHRAHPQGEVADLLRHWGYGEDGLEKGIAAVGGIEDYVTPGPLDEMPPVSRNVDVILDNALGLTESYNPESDKLIRVRDLLGGIFLSPSSKAYQALGWMSKERRPAVEDLARDYGEFLQQPSSGSLAEFLSKRWEPSPAPPPGDGGSGDGRPPVTREETAVARAAHSDLPLGPNDLDQEDRLGYGVYAAALYQLVTHRDTSLPLSVGVSAPWGSGKTSIMKWVQIELDRHRREEDHSCRVSTVTDWNSQEARIRSEAAARDKGLVRRFRTVWIDAWRFEENAALWAAFTKEIYKQGQSQMARRPKSAVSRTLSRLKLRLALAHGGGRLTGWPTLMYRAARTWTGATSLVGGAAVGLALATGVGQIVDVATPYLTQGIAGAVAALGALVTTAKGTFRQPFSFNLDKVLSAAKQSPEAVDPVTAPEDVGRLIDLLTPLEEDGLAVFIDDLDRCSPDKVKDAVEAINLLFAAASTHRNDRTPPRVAFFLGMDAEMVATSIRVAYKDMVEELRRRDHWAAEDFGHRFLTKIVQVSFEIPDPHDAKMSAFVDDLLDLQQHRPDSESAAAEAVEEVRGQQRSGEVGELRRALVDKARTLTDEERKAFVDKAQRALEEENVRALSKDSEEVIAAMKQSAPILSPRPRDHKRFVNAVRLQMLAGMRFTDVAPGKEPAVASHTAKWTAMCMHWPALVHEVRRDRDLIARLEAWARSGSADGSAVPSRIAPLLNDPQFKEALQAEPSLASIDLTSMLLVH